MVKRKSKRITKVKGVPVKISPELKKDLQKVINDFKKMGLDLTFAEASEIYRRDKK